MTNQNKFQNAGQSGSFAYNEVGNQVPNFFLVLLTFVMLIALLRSEARFRELLLRLSQDDDETS